MGHSKEARGCEKEKEKGWRVKMNEKKGDGGEKKRGEREGERGGQRPKTSRGSHV